MTRVVIFDMDGVLIDSEMIYLQSIHQNLSANGYPISIEDLYATVGMDDRKCRALISRLAGKEITDLAFQHELDRLFQIPDVNYAEILKPGVVETLAALQSKQILLGLASSSRREVIDRVLRQCQLRNYFNYLISGEEFKESKPNPEIYLYVAEKMQCDPAECIVVEDSPYGIQAGKSAGMRVAAIREERFQFDQSGADWILEQIKQVIELVQ